MNELLLVMSVLLSFLVLLEAWSFQQKKLKRTMEMNLFWNPEHSGKEGEERHVQGQMFGGPLEAVGAQIISYLVPWLPAALHADPHLVRY